MDTLFSDQLRTAIRNAELSVYAICQATGLDKAVMSRFLNGKSGLSVASIDRICHVLGLRLVSGKEASKRRKNAK
jgi:transcriptional regulator with XRE-family HTH domain